MLVSTLLRPNFAVEPKHMSRKIIFYLVFFSIMVFGFYISLKAFIPGYGDRSFQILNQVRPFNFINQDGDTITQEDTRGKVYVAEYFFTTCTGICPIMNTNLKDIYDEYKDNPDFLILSHTCDPDQDSTGRLRWYADSMQVNTDRWWFLTGSKDSLYHAARVSYLLDDPANNSINIEEQFLHTQFFALVDRKGQVRKKIYDGLKKDELKELKKDIETLIAEPQAKRFVNDLYNP